MNLRFAATVSLLLCSPAVSGQSGAVPAHRIDPALGQDEQGPAIFVALARKHPELSAFVDATVAAGLADRLTDGTRYTIFAPANQTLERRDFDELLKPENRRDLIDLLRAHIVAGDVDRHTARTIGSARTIDGETLEVVIEDGTLRVGDAAAIDVDLVSGRIRIYVIDAVLAVNSLGARGPAASRPARDRSRRPAPYARNRRRA